MILVTGATGFVGRSVVAGLCAEGLPVRALVRPGTRSAELERLGAERAEGDMTDPASLADAVSGCEAVIHLVAIISGSPEEFEAVMVRGTHDLVSAASAAGTRRLVLISALGGSDPRAHAIPYYRAKQMMEQTVGESGIPHVILRPSFVFGRDGGALRRFVRIARTSPVLPVLGPGTQRIQPLWVDDLAAVTRRALDTPAAGGTFALGGPDAVTWNELWLRIARALGKRRRLVHVPFGLARGPAALLERFPRPPLTRDQLAMLALGDNVADIGPAQAAFGFEPIGLDEQLERATRS